VTVQGALTAPTAAEVEKLRRYLQLVRRLTSAPLFKGACTVGVNLRHDDNGVLQQDIIAPVSELEMSGLLTSFRQLWMASEPSAFPHVLALLRKNAAALGGAAADALIAELDDIGKAYKDVRKSSPDLDVLEAQLDGDQLIDDGPVRAERVLDDWVNGDIFHSDPEKRERFQNREDRNMYWLALLVTVQDIAKVYVRLARVIKDVLHEATLVSPPGE
jgi:hypothetical protein